LWEEEGEATPPTLALSLRLRLTRRLVFFSTDSELLYSNLLFILPLDCGEVTMRI
jgi:hypothetical protein